MSTKEPRKEHKNNEHIGSSDARLRTRMEGGEEHLVGKTAVITDMTHAFRVVMVSALAAGSGLA